jgi:hypothetical protein
MSLNIRGGSGKGEKMCKMTQELSSQERKEEAQMWAE